MNDVGITSDVAHNKFMVGVFLLFLCLDVLDYWIKLEKGVSIVNHLQYAAFVGPLILLSLVASRYALGKSIVSQSIRGICAVGSAGNEYQHPATAHRLMSEWQPLADNNDFVCIALRSPAKIKSDHGNVDTSRIRTD